MQLSKTSPSSDCVNAQPVAAWPLSAETSIRMWRACHSGILCYDIRRARRDAVLSERWNRRASEPWVRKEESRRPELDEMVCGGRRIRTAGNDDLKSTADEQFPYLLLRVSQDELGRIRCPCRSQCNLTQRFDSARTATSISSKIKQQLFYCLNLWVLPQN